MKKQKKQKLHIHKSDDKYNLRFKYLNFININSFVNHDKNNNNES